MELPIVRHAALTKERSLLNRTMESGAHRSLLVGSSEPDRLLIRTFIFPGSNATVDGEPALLIPGERLRIEFSDSDHTVIRSAGFNGGQMADDWRTGKVVGTETLGQIARGAAQSNQSLFRRRD